MPRISAPAVCSIACLILLIPARSPQAAGPGETLLPEATKGFVSVADVDDLVEHWNQTQVGQLMADPVMEPFVEDFQRQLRNRLSGFQKKLGLTLDDFKDVPSGELTVAVVCSADDEAALVVLMDVTDRLEQARAMLEKAKTNLINDGAKLSEDTLSDPDVVVLDLPKEEDAEEDQPQEQAIYFLKEEINFLGASDDMGVMEGVLARLDGQEQPTLADFQPFKHVIDRCQQDAGESTPQIRWYIDPIGYLDLVQAESFPGGRPRGKSKLDILKNQGFTAIQAVGGYIDLAVDGCELLHRTAILAPPPYEKSMKMLVFPNSQDLAPQAWVPREIATYTTVYADVLNAFDNVGPLVDELFGEGTETDVFKDILEGLKNDPNGPRIDLRAELVANLANRMTAISDYQMPITTTSERLLFAVEAKDEERVAAAIAKTLKNDDEFEPREFKEYVVWENVPQKKPEIPTISLAMPPIGGEDEDLLGGGADAIQQETEPLLPNMAVTVAYGQLMVASHYDFLVKILEEIDERETLAHDVAFRVVQDTMLNKLGAEDNFLRTFSRTDEEYRPTYELIRQGKMPQSETMLGRMLNSILLVDKEGELRAQEIDGSKLPDYDFVRRHLGPAGMFGTSEEEGWFIEGFMLSKESP